MVNGCIEYAHVLSEIGISTCLRVFVLIDCCVKFEIDKKKICSFMLEQAVRSYHTVCPRSSNPFYIVSYYINGSLILGHSVCEAGNLDEF